MQRLIISILGMLLCVMTFTVPGVAGDEYAGKEFVAFSLNAAEQKIESAASDNWRKKLPDVYKLGGITRIRGVVHDKKTGDIIVVGHRDKALPTLTLDDLVVALRARFKYNGWPVVSIDPSEDMLKTKMQDVRFEGGIQGTQFGKDMFEADLILKKISMGTIDSGVPGLKGTWDPKVDYIKSVADKQEKFEILARFWFYPVNEYIPVYGDVAVVEGLEISVFTQLMSAVIDGEEVGDVSVFDHPFESIDEQFREGMAANFDKVAKAHPPIARLKGLNELVAISRALEIMTPQPRMFYWLYNYEVKAVKTPTQQKVLERKKTIKTTKGNYRYFNDFMLYGGVELMAIAIGVESGDADSIRDAVLLTRPSPSDLTWSFSVSNWGYLEGTTLTSDGSIGDKFAQAMFYYQGGNYEGAIDAYSQLLENTPEHVDAYISRGCLYLEMFRFGEALADFNQAIKLSPASAEVYVLRGLTVECEVADFKRAVRDYSKAIELNPNLADAYYFRGMVYSGIDGDYERAIADFNQAIKLNPDYADAYVSRGNALYDAGKGRKQAFKDYQKAIDIDPAYFAPYFSRGYIYSLEEDYKKAVSEFTTAIKLDPENPDSYRERGISYALLLKTTEALEDFIKLAELLPDDATSYFLRGMARLELEMDSQAESDFSRAIKLDPGWGELYYWRATANYYLGRYNKAWDDVEKSRKNGYQPDRGFLKDLRKASGTRS